MVSVDYDIIATVDVDISAGAPKSLCTLGDAEYLYYVVAVRPQCHCNLKAKSC
jgi:hypothetical protein